MGDQQAARMESEITFIVVYRCPHCAAALEARSGESSSWLRCPKCGRAGRPPEHMRTPPSLPPPPGDDVLIIGPTTDLVAMTPVAQPRPATYSGSTRRIVFATLLFLAIVMFVLSIVEANFNYALVFGIFGIVFIVLLARPGKSE
jgi:hypothetical protein